MHRLCTLCETLLVSSAATAEVVAKLGSNNSCTAILAASSVMTFPLPQAYARTRSSLSMTPYPTTYCLFIHTTFPSHFGYISCLFMLEQFGVLSLCRQDVPPSCMGVTHRCTHGCSSGCMLIVACRHCINDPMRAQL